MYSLSYFGLTRNYKNTKDGIISQVYISYNSSLLDIDISTGSPWFPRSKL